VGKVVDLFSGKELEKEAIIPTPESEIISLLKDVERSMKYHKIMNEYAAKLKSALEAIYKSYEDTDQDNIKWARMGSILDNFENLIDISQPDHKNVINSVFDDPKKYNLITDAVLRQIVKDNI
jgi:hypothetical protein